MNLEALNPGHRRPFLDLVNKLRDSPGGPLSNNLDGGIRAVAHITAQAQPQCCVPDKEPETDSLNSAVHNDFLCLR